MNQILSTSSSKKGASINTKGLVIFLAICMLIFGVVLVATGSYGFYQGAVASSSSNAVKPEITVVENGDGTLTITATHELGIESIVYSWNGGEQETISGNSNASVVQTIDLLSGTNTLTATATATNGEAIIFEKAYTLSSSIDIELSAQGANLQAVITGQDEISFVTYRWDNEEEQTVEINSTVGEVSIEIPEGQHTLTLIAVDVNNNTETITQEVRGVTSPELSVTQDGDRFIVSVSDSSGLDRVEFTLNGNEYVVRLDGAQEKAFAYSLDDGTNELEVTVYNVDEASTTVNETFTK